MVVAGQDRAATSASAMSIERYATDEHYAHLNFPQPLVVVDRIYWSATISTLDALPRRRDLQRKSEVGSAA